MTEKADNGVKLFEVLYNHDGTAGHGIITKMKPDTGTVDCTRARRDKKV